MKSRWAQRYPALALQFITGTTAAIAGAQALATWISTCGISLPSQLAMLATCGITLSASGLATRYAVNSASLRWGCMSAFLCLATLLPSLLNQSLTAGARVFGEPQWLPFLLPAAVMAVYGLSITAWIRTVVPVDHSATSTLHSATLAGLACGLMVPMVHGVIVFPAYLPLAVCVVVATVTRQVLKAPNDSTAVESPASDGLENSAFDWKRVIQLCGLAVFVHSATRHTATFMPVTFPLLLPALSITSILWWAITRPRLQMVVTRSRISLGILLLPALLPLAFQTQVDFNLHLNATVSSAFLLMTFRCLQLAVVWGMGLLVATATSLKRTSLLNASATNVGLLLIGLILGLLLPAAGLSPMSGIVVGLLLMAAGRMNDGKVPADESAESRSAKPRVRFSPSFAVVCSAAVLVLVVYPVKPSDAIQLLFSARASDGYRSGLGSDLIAQSSSTRILEERYTGSGHLTCWRTSGDQLQVRRNGIPAGQISTNTKTTPQPLPETLPVLLPLVLHRNATSILLLGDQTGSGLQVCREFPLHTVTSVGVDSASVAFVAEAVGRPQSQPSSASSSNTDRFVLSHKPVAVAVRRKPAEGRRFDVVVAMSPNPTSLESAEQLTPQFYSAVRSQLTDNGVFCQRITRHDIGATPLFRIISAVSETFERVVMVHMAAGEIALVAGVSSDAVLDQHLLTRLQRTHVTRVLNESGWDWSQVAALPVVDTADPVGIFEHTPQLTAASSQNLHFVYSLPLESVSWNDKAAELRSTFAPHQQRLADAAPRGPGYDEFARRFSAVVQQAEILNTFPDQPWPYRRSLKSEMQRNARPPVETVHDGKVVRQSDPRDEHRKNYFVTLGQVLQQLKSGGVDLLSLRELSGFTSTYEPLLSHFAHHELVRIHRLSGHPSPAQELRHRLHTVYFTEGGDFSVRQVSDAMEQILDDPELMEDVASRYDHVNSMLQELVRRWELRQSYEPSSARATQRDIDHCIRTAKRSLDAMQEWSITMDVPDQDIAARRRFINRALVSPLRTYGEQVLAHRIRNEAPLSPTEDLGADDLPLLINPTDALTN